MADETRERLRHTRRVATPWSDDATRGMTPARLDGLLERWANGYDWDVHERRIRALPWETVQLKAARTKTAHEKLRSRAKQSCG